MSDDENEVNYIKASDPSTWRKTEEETWGDKFLKPGTALSHRHRELARLLAHGKTTTEIAEKLNYTMARVSVLKSNTRIKDEVQKFQDQMFKVDEANRIKELTGDALNVMEEILVSHNLDPKEKESAARWILEKATGKPAQAVDTTHTFNLGDILDKMDNMKTIKEVSRKSLPESEVIEIEVTEKETSDEFAEWLDKNL